MRYNPVMAGFPILYLAEADPEAAVLSSGVIARLLAEAPNAAFTIVGSPESAPLFRDVPGLERLIVLEREGQPEWLRLWWRLRGRRWGLIVDQRGTRLSERLSRQRRAVRRPPDPGDEPVHAVVEAARLLMLEDDPPAPRLFFGEETRAAAQALVGPADGPILAVGPGVDWIGKRWPAERFTKLATCLLGPGGPMAGGRLMIVGRFEDRDAAHTIRFAVARERVIELQGRLDLLETAAALSRARLFLGADSVWTQLAVAVGVPAVAVYGPSDEARNGPWGGRAVRGPRSLEDFRALDPGLNQAIQHMMDLPAEPVLDAALRLYAETEPRPSAATAESEDA